MKQFFILQDIHLNDIVLFGKQKENIQGDYDIDFEPLKVTESILKDICSWTDLDIDEFIKPMDVTQSFLRANHFLENPFTTSGTPIFYISDTLDDYYVSIRFAKKIVVKIIRGEEIDLVMRYDTLRVNTLQHILREAGIVDLANSFVVNKECN